MIQGIDSLDEPILMAWIPTEIPGAQADSAVGWRAATTIVVISTHILEEVSAVCKAARWVMAHGRLLADGNPLE